jgi:diguanylate cyclase (GGDEF)-like protein
MVISSIRTLLIEDNPADARVLREALAEVPEAAFELEWVDGLGKGLQKLESGLVDLVLLDLYLPESRGLATFTTTHECAPGLPIIVLTGLDDRELALKAVRDGAQDYLVKGQVSGPSLVRAMQHAVVRHRMQGEAAGPSWRDSLTGLYNRQGFLVLGEQLLRLADNGKCKLALVYADVDGLEKINQAYGREEGDAALQSVAAALREAFPESDLVARVGGDEFACMCFSLCPGPKLNVKSILESALQAHPHCGQGLYPLTASCGVSTYDPAKPCAMATLIKSAAAQVRPDSPSPAA